MSMMRRGVLTGLAAGFGLMLAACSGIASPDTELAADDNTVIYLVRHAEKTAERPDPGLTDKGRARAIALADRLENAGLTAILSSDYIRTRETARPISTRLGIGVELYDARDLPALAMRLKTMQGRILVVGHSNTTPMLAELLGGNPGTPIDEAGEYDRLYIVTLSAGPEVTSELQRYGTAYVAAGD